MEPVHASVISKVEPWMETEEVFRSGQEYV
jgi:hypothetical protein